jgi:transcription initiation factor TFIID subunit 6
MNKEFVIVYIDYKKLVAIIVCLQKVLSPLLKTLRQPPDYVEEYRTEYGYLGPALHAAVLKARTQPAPNPATSSANNANAAATAAPAPPTVTAPTPRGLSSQAAIVQTGLLLHLCFLGGILPCIGFYRYWSLK